MRVEVAVPRRRFLRERSNVSPWAVLVVMCVGYFLVLLDVTPAVVAAAIAAVPGARAGLASAVNNTARQAGGALGIAVAGAVAGSALSSHAFVEGFHAVALGAACLYGVAALAGLALLPGGTFVSARARRLSVRAR